MNIQECSTTTRCNITKKNFLSSRQEVFWNKWETYLYTRITNYIKNMKLIS